MALLSFMVRYKHPEGKLLITGGGIADVNDVRPPFTGLIQAVQHYASEIKVNKIQNRIGARARTMWRAGARGRFRATSWA